MPTAKLFLEKKYTFICWVLKQTTLITLRHSPPPPPLISNESAIDLTKDPNGIVQRRYTTLLQSIHDTTVKGSKLLWNYSGQSLTAGVQYKLNKSISWLSSRKNLWLATAVSSLLHLPSERLCSFLSLIPFLCTSNMLKRGRMSPSLI